MLVSEMLDQGHPRCICFCWYGGRQDGVDVFHTRLEKELSRISKGRSWSERPDWPAVINRRGFCEMLGHTLDVSDIAEIGSAVRNRLQGRKRQLLYVNHVPIESKQQLDPFQFLEYLRWWDEAVLNYLEPQQHVVLGVSFITENPVQFRHAVEEIARIPEHPFSDRFDFEMLPVLDPLKATHLRTFFRKINMQLRLDHDDQERVIAAILADTEGEYDLVVRRLEVLISGGFEEFLDRTMKEPAQEESNDFGY